jgi:hypothetical protein
VAGRLPTISASVLRFPLLARYGSSLFDVLFHRSIIGF